jgi:hypothetical protein
MVDEANAPMQWIRILLFISHPRFDVARLMADAGCTQLSASGERAVKTAAGELSPSANRPYRMPLIADIAL